MPMMGGTRTLVDMRREKADREGVAHYTPDIVRSFIVPTMDEIRGFAAKDRTTTPRVVRRAHGTSHGGRTTLPPEQRGVTGRDVRNDIFSPALAPFLSLLEADVAARPALAMAPLSNAVADRLQTMAAEMVNDDPATPIKGKVSL